MPWSAWRHRQQRGMPPWRMWEILTMLAGALVLAAVVLWALVTLYAPSR
jgi:hypothetical protein